MSKYFIQKIPTWEIIPNSKMSCILGSHEPNADLAMSIDKKGSHTFYIPKEISSEKIHSFISEYFELWKFANLKIWSDDHQHFADIIEKRKTATIKDLKMMVNDIFLNSSCFKEFRKYSVESIQNPSF